MIHHYPQKKSPKYMFQRKGGQHLHLPVQKVVLFTHKHKTNWIFIEHPPWASTVLSAFLCRILFNSHTNPKGFEYFFIVLQRRKQCRGRLSKFPLDTKQVNIHSVSRNQATKCWIPHHMPNPSTSCLHSKYF